MPVCFNPPLLSSVSYSVLFCIVSNFSIYYSYLCVCSADQGRRIGRVGKGAGGGAGPPPMGGG